MMEGYTCIICGKFIETRILPSNGVCPDPECQDKHYKTPMDHLDKMRTKKQPIIPADQETLNNLTGNIITGLVNKDLMHKRDVLKVEAVIRVALNKKVVK